MNGARSSAARAPSSASPASSSGRPISATEGSRAPRIVATPMKVIQPRRPSGSGTLPSVPAGACSAAKAWPAGIPPARPSCHTSVSGAISPAMNLERTNDSSCGPLFSRVLGTT